MAADGIDAELGGLLFKLKKMQKEVGGGTKDAVISVIGEDGKQDQFLTIKAQLMEHVAATKVVSSKCTILHYFQHKILSVTSLAKL